MSAKWRAIQHRHRYTYNAVAFPPHFVWELSRTPDGPPFFRELEQFVSLNSTYAQLEHVKRIAAAFSNLLAGGNADEKTISRAVKLYLEIFFLENSLPLHRTLASVLSKCKNHLNSIKTHFQQLCNEYGGGENARNGKKFRVSRAALSMMSTPKLGYLVHVVEQCAILVGLDVVSSLDSIVNETNEWLRPSPLVMEQCQDALSCMYYLLQRFPEKFYNSMGQNMELSDLNVLEMALMNIVSILKSQEFSRDCFVSAGVALCAALQVCLCPEELGLYIMQGIFHETGIQGGEINLSMVEEKIPFKGDLFDEINKFPALSRLCLIRGILTAVSRTTLDTHYVVLNDDGNGAKDGHSVKTILYDAVLPELCRYVENPSDSHSNFHALTVMQICLQQIKALLQGDTGGTPDKYDPIPEAIGARILKIVWNNLEDPLSQTVKQVHQIFDLYLDIHSSLHWTEDNEYIKLFLRRIALDLLCLGPRCKGRYVPLSSLTRKLGAKSILEMNQNLLFETANAYIDDDVCCAATTFLKCFLECLRNEYWSSDGVDNGYSKYRSHSLLPFVHGLAFGLAKLRSNLNTYALPVLLELDVDSIFSMLALIGISPVVGPLFSHTDISLTDMDLRLEQKITVLVSLLKVSRLLALMEGNIDWHEVSSASPEVAGLDLESSSLNCVVGIKGIEVLIPVRWVILSLTHIDESLRMDAAEALFLNPKTASLPSSLELNLMRRAVPLNMKCCSTAFQMKWNSLFRKFFSRVRTALERQLRVGAWKPLASSGDSKGICLHTRSKDTIKHRAEDLFDFTKWLSCFLFFSCYPSAPYERKIMAMELLLIMLNVWPVVPTLSENKDTFHCEINLYPYSRSLALPDSTLLLVGSIVDSWDRLRENSFRVLLYFPTPLPGIANPDLVREAVLWAKKLVCSPRVRESDAGALMMRLLFRKYVLELRWIVKPSCNFVTLSEAELPNGAHDVPGSPVVTYLCSLTDWLLFTVEDAEKNLPEACRNSFVHGILLTLRYAFEELDWNSNVLVHSLGEMKDVLKRLLELVTRITSLALGVVSADAWYLPDDDIEEMGDDEAFDVEIPDKIDLCSQKKSQDGGKVMIDEEIGPSDQIVMVGCWLAMKEVSLLLGTVVRKVPLPTVDDTPKAIATSTDKSGLPSDVNVMLDLHQLETIGNHFLEVLLKMKHNGAIDKTRAGFTALCNRLLCSNDSRLCKLTESWMDILMERTTAKGQTVDDLLRRSAGIPAAFIAFFLSEPEGTPKRLLPRALRWLLDVVMKSLANQQSKATYAAAKETSKFRDEGVVPTVHAFNVLRAAFNDTNLATDTSGFCADAMIICVRSFSSSYWEVRNSACLAFTALLRRMVGFLNVHRRESARRALTGLEFFHRYPTLHSFLMDELKVATEFVPQESPERHVSNLKKIVHPSLCPMLILLSRLKPSPLSSETGDPLDPFLFMPFIRRCSLQSNFRIRVLASGALTGIVSNEKLPPVISHITRELPRHETQTSSNSTHGILLQLNTLLDSNCRNLPDPAKKDEILHEMVGILTTSLWIGRPKLSHCPIIDACLLKLLDRMLSISRTCPMGRAVGPVLKILRDFSSECLDSKPPDHQLYFEFDPTVQELRKQAAVSYFNCVFQTSNERGDDEILSRKILPPTDNNSFSRAEIEDHFAGFEERLICSMSDALYEVRIATLKWLNLFLKRRELYGRELYCDRREQLCIEALSSYLSRVNLPDLVMKLLVSEKHHKCKHYLLKILYSLNSFESRDCNSVFQLWGELVSLLELTSRAKTRQTLVCCLGICAKQISNLFMNRKNDTNNTNRPFSYFYEALSYFVGLIEQNSEASNPVIMRKAAAESLVASGLLAHVEPLGLLVSNKSSSSNFNQEIRLYARKVLDLWSMCVKLLEDEDVGLRKKLALSIQKHFRLHNSPDAVASSQVERVVESCFEHLSRIFGHWDEYLNHLCRWVLNVLSGENYASALGGDLVRRVFDKEIDNHHEEKLLICQVICSHLGRIPVSNKPEARGILSKWRTRFFEQLVEFTCNRVGVMARVDWFGGVGNHKDAFLPIYANLLAFYALSSRAPYEDGDSQRVVREVSSLGEAICPFIGNPLICNLYLMVIKSNERHLGMNADSLRQRLGDRGCGWDEFDPYFLLR